MDQSDKTPSLLGLRDFTISPVDSLENGRSAIIHGMSITVVIFDMDGVLIDSSAAHFESWRRLASDLGAKVTQAQFGSTFGRQNRDIIPLLFGGSLSTHRVAELGEIKERYYRELVKDDVPVLPGAADLIRSCHGTGLRLAVGSSGHPENIAMALRVLGVDELIECVVTGEDVTVGKPDPQVFLMAAERLGVSPSSCVVIEDAPAGIDAALAAGMRAIGVTTGHPRERLAHAHLVVDGLNDLDPQRIRDLSLV